MRSTRFAERFTKKTGIGELMDDMGRAMQGRTDMYMLGGGNPAHIPEVNRIWRRRIEEILKNGTELEETLANYDTPQGKHAFLESLANLMNREYGWNIGPKNIGVTNGSQIASFLLLNMFSGTGTDGRFNRILFPLCPEYIGYADQAIEDGALITHPRKNRTHTGALLQIPRQFRQPEHRRRHSRSLRLPPHQSHRERPDRR